MYYKIFCLLTVWTALLTAKPKSDSDSTFAHYKDFYNVDNVMTKLTDNKGEGREDLYGTRNFRAVLHGVAYRGGGNNYGNKTNPRDNKNPLPQEGLENLLNAGFSKAIYLYSTNFETAEKVIVDSSGDDTLMYYQYDGHTPEEEDSIIKFAYEAIQNRDTGPIYYHCWNGWHQSGYVSAILLKQFCGYSNKKSIHYWEDATDNWNRGYDRIRDAIRKFEPISKYAISQDIGDEICPDYSDPRENDTVETINTNIKSINDSINFSSGSKKFPPELSTFLDEYSKRLNSNPYFNVEISGHTDSKGDPDRNEKLSYNRAEAVHKYLINQGADSTRLTYKGYGETRLTNHCKDGVDCSEEEHAENRRVVFKITSISLHINYELNSTQVPQSDKSMLRDAFAILALDKDLAIEIQGYSSRDSVEADKVEENLMVNKNISDRRASNIYDFLKDIGFNMENVTYKGYGWSEDMEYNNEADRRIEFKILEQI